MSTKTRCKTYKKTLKVDTNNGLQVKFHLFCWGVFQMLCKTVEEIGKVLNYIRML